MAVVTIVDEIRAAHDRVKALVTAAQTTDRDLTPEEDREVKALVAKMEALQAKRACRPAREPAQHDQRLGRPQVIDAPAAPAAPCE